MATSGVTTATSHKQSTSCLLIHAMKTSTGRFLSGFNLQHGLRLHPDAQWPAVRTFSTTAFLITSAGIQLQSGRPPCGEFSMSARLHMTTLMVSKENKVDAHHALTTLSLEGWMRALHDSCSYCTTSSQWVFQTSVDVTLLLLHYNHDSSHASGLHTTACACEAARLAAVLLILRQRC
jgi:hypothetical protein